MHVDTSLNYPFLESREVEARILELLHDSEVDKLDDLFDLLSGYPLSFIKTMIIHEFTQLS